MWKYMNFLLSKTIFWQILLFAMLHFSLSENFLSYPMKSNVSNKNLSQLSDRISKKYAIEYITFLKTGEESFELRQLHKQLLSQRSNNSWAHGFHSVDGTDQYLACTVCRTIVFAAQYIIRDPLGEWVGVDKESYAKRIFLNLCRDFNILKEDVCKGFFRAYWPIFQYTVQNSRMDGRMFCNRLGIEFCNIEPPKHNWVLALNDDERNIHSDKTRSVWNGLSKVQILQISDIHYDPDYKYGALADCEEPLCCHDRPYIKNIKPENLAKFWGDYRACDAPLSMIENAFNQMRRTHQDVKYIYFTGDILPHATWKTSRADIMEMFSHMDKLMAEKFPGIPVYPCIGNNDVHPNDFSSPADVPESINTKWLYTRLYWLWAKHLPSDTRETILRGGYYTVSPHFGFRIISLNSNECRLNNIWIYFNTTFAVEQLHWLHDTLLLAEQAREYVHILSHTPIESAECWKPWSQEYFRLIERFQHIITGIFYGHTHRNDMSVHYDSNGRAVNVAWHGGSLTSFAGINPSYRVYETVPPNMQIIDHETWTFNLTAANANGSTNKPQWFRLSHFAEDFSSDLSAAGIGALFERMSANPALLRKYWRSKVSNSDPMISSGCGTNCLQDTLCDSVNSQSHCEALKAKLQYSLLKETAGQSRASLKIIVFLISLFIVFV